jgi:hypothetical protein
MACTLGQSLSKKQPTSLPPTDTANPVESPTKVELPTEIVLATGVDVATLLPEPTQAEATAAEAPTALPEPTQPEPTAVIQDTNTPAAAPSAPVSGDYFAEKFAGDISDFTRWVTVGNSKIHYGDLAKGLLKFELPTMDTYAYATRNGYTYSDVFVQATGNLVSGSNASLAVVCRVSDAGWDEFRVSTRGLFAGTYEVYRYDKSLVGEHKVPYVNLIGVDHISTLDIKTGTTKNTIGLSCVGQELRVFINGVEQTKHNKKLVDKVLTSGTVGVAVIGYYSTASTVQYESLETQKP